MVTAERYSQQLRRLEEAIQKTPGSTTWSDSSASQRPTTHTANMTKATIQELDWEILPHPSYSPDIAPSDYHLFRSLSNNLRGVSFNNDAELQNWLDLFSRPNWRISSSVESEICPNVGRQS
jgi:hypothetical protein